MKEQKRKSSLKITLALIGSVTFASCGEDGYRNIYKNIGDCTTEWGAGRCEGISSDSGDYSSGHYYGPFVSRRSGISQATRATRSSGISSVTRGGFGGSSMSHSSSGRS